jgi:hypothetical protein
VGADKAGCYCAHSERFNSEEERVRESGREEAETHTSSNRAPLHLVGVRKHARVFLASGDQLCTWEEAYVVLSYENERDAHDH